MCQALERLPAGDVVLLHASCHNPTGADLSQEQWQELVPLFRRRILLPYIDMAYQGLGNGQDEDAFGIRLFAAELPEVLVAVSCSKNFGLYRERVGVLHVVTDQPADAAWPRSATRCASRAASIPCRRIMAPPSSMRSSATMRCGPAGSQELGSCANASTGCAAAGRAAAAAPARTGLRLHRAAAGHVLAAGPRPRRWRAAHPRHHVYMTDDSRINIAGLRGTISSTSRDPWRRS